MALAPECPALGKFVFTEHSRFEMERRGISEEEVTALLQAPAQSEPQRIGRCAYQERTWDVQASKSYVLRVFVDMDREPPEVVSAYKTSKVEKYWRHHAGNL
jgi:hypothetical protein